MNLKKIVSSRITWFFVGGATVAVILKGQPWLDKLPGDFSGWATIISVAVVIGLYYLEQRSKKTTAARLVLKEIDTVLPIVKAMVEDKKYDLRHVGITTEHWRNHSYLFMADMSQAEVDQIEKIYSYGKYIQKHMAQVDEFKIKEYQRVYQKARDTDQTGTIQTVVNSDEVKKQITHINEISDALVSTFPQEAAKEIKDAQGWIGYDKLKQIARLK